jgi:hypothetical protein
MMGRVSEQQPGIVFPRSADGRRSTADLGRAVVADALREVDPAGALDASQETSWRSGYLPHFRRLLEAGLSSRESALTIARDGLDSLHERMRVVGAEGRDVPLNQWDAALDERELVTAEVPGEGEADGEFSLPYHGRRLRGDELHRRLDAWLSAGVMEESAAESVRTVMANPEWLHLEGRTVAVLGAGAEMGPLQALLRWGATVAAVDLPRPDIWRRVLEAARRGAGTVLLPLEPTGEGDLHERTGADLVAEVPAVARWLGDLGGTLVLGNYVYADGATNVRVSMAVDALSTRLLEVRDDVALAFLATPTDVFAVPKDAVDRSTQNYDGRSPLAKLAGRPLRAVSGGRLLHRSYVPGSDPGVNDSLVPQQGPNYALAKRLQRWRASVAREGGTTVSLNVAPPTRTRSVVKNRALAAAYAGAHRFGVEVFEPATSNVLMAALLVADLHGDAAERVHPWQDEAAGAVHGGLWRTGYAPRSALGLAALLGYGAARA